MYAKMLKEVASAVHAQAPGMPVVSAGFSPHADTDNNAIGFSNFLDKLYKFGAAQQADAIGIHPYPGVGPAQDYIGDVRVYLGKIQQVLARNGDSDDAALGDRVRRFDRPARARSRSSTRAAP